MANKFSSKRTGSIFSLIWQAGMLFLLLGTSLSACGITLFSSNCSGVNVFCSNNGTIFSPDPASQAHAVATVTTIKKNKPLVSDPLNKQDSNLWGNDAYCSFHDHAYFVEYSSPTQGTYVCDSSRLHYGDVAIQMDVTATLASESAGIVFRADPGLSEYYNFAISQGQYSLGGFGNNSTTTLIPATSNSAIRGVGKKNTLLVVTKGDDIKLFINGVFVGETHDSTLTSGYVGVSLTNYAADASAIFANMVIYRA